MDIIAKSDDLSIPAFLTVTPEAFVPLLTARKAHIASTPKKTFKYGSSDRHQLNVFYPARGTELTPILFFVYGGGFATGSRELVPGLVYDSLGAFFAQRGLLTIIADYRLVPQVKYPEPTYDLRDAISFVLSSPEVDVSSNGGDKNRVYIMGHSAGAAITATLLLRDDFLSPEERARIKGVVFSTGAYGVSSMWPTYYGEPEEEANRRTPLGLLNSRTPEQLKESLPRLLLLTAERDASFVVDWNVLFQKTLREKGVTNFQEYIMEGHNHISPNLALCSGEGEEWGEQVARWIKG